MTEERFLKRWLEKQFKRTKLSREGGDKIEKKFYTLHDVKEIKRVENIEEVNNLLLEKKWILLAVETTKDNLQKYLLGRIE